MIRLWHKADMSRQAHDDRFEGRSGLRLSDGVRSAYDPSGYFRRQPSRANRIDAVLEPLILVATAKTSDRKGRVVV